MQTRAARELRCPTRVAELHRILKPGRVPLVAVRHISMCGSQYDEVWRVTREGLSACSRNASGPTRSQSGHAEIP